MYSKEEKIAIVRWYNSNNSMRQVRDLFSVSYPERPIPSVGTIHTIIKKFNGEGCVINSHKKRTKVCPVLTEEQEIQILCYSEENPITPSRIIANEFGISKSSVLKTFKKYKYKPYKFSNHQQIFPLDKIKRTKFCETVFNLLNENDNILAKIVFTDESSFCLDGTVNSQNYRYWSRTNKHVQNLTHTQYNRRVNVWTGIVDGTLIGPFFIDGTLTAAKFLELLRRDIMPQIEVLNIENAWFQMDGAPPHSTGPITRFLNETFQDRWIGRFGPIAWPPRSPDLSPNDFFLWGYRVQRHKSSFYKKFCTRILQSFGILFRARRWSF